MNHKFPRGFKTKAEATSLDIRKKLRLTVENACPARQVAKLHGVTVTPASALCGPLLDTLLAASTNEFTDPERIRRHMDLLSKATSEFSGLVAIVRGYTMILYNGNNSLARQESDIMHEMAHVLCGHEGECLQLNADLSLRVHNTDHEEEAKWLGATLQIPEEGIYRHARAGRTSEEIAVIYGASLQMTNYRRRILGIDKRIARSKRF